MNFLQRVGLIPRFTEVSLFLSSVTFLLLLSDAEFVRALSGFAFTNFAVMIPIAYLLGLIFSFYYAISNKKTPLFAKVCMLLFVILTNFWVAFFAFISILREGNGYYIIFPLLNLIQAFIILSLVSVVMNERCISDENAKPVELFIGTLLICFLFLISHFVLKNYWAITFSICLSYSSVINDAVTKTFQGRIKLTEKRKKKR